MDGPLQFPSVFDTTPKLVDGTKQHAGSRMELARLLAELSARAVATPCGLPALTWLCAIPGSGKTLLLARLFRQLQDAGETVVWIGLREAGTPASQITLRLDSECAAGSQRRFILIDNLDHCPEATGGRFIDDLLVMLGSQDRLVVASASRLSFSEIELRIRDQLLLLDDGHFRLDAAEIEAGLPPDVVARIGPGGLARVAGASSGWLIAARLIGLQLRQKSCPELYLDDLDQLLNDLDPWIERNVLDPLSPEQQLLLCQLAQFRSFDTHQADWVFDDPQTGARLASVVAQLPGLFMSPGQDGRRRLHEPLHSHLRRVAQRRLAPPARDRLRQRLIQWCISFGEWQDGLHYAIEAGDWTALATILDCGGEKLVLRLGDTETYVAAVQALIAAGQRPSAGIMRLYAFCQTFRLHDIHRATWDQVLAASPGGDLDVPTPEAICRLFWHNDDEALHRTIGQWLASAGHKEPFEIVWVRHIQAAALMRTYQFALARAALIETVPLLEKMKLPFLSSMDDAIHCALLLYEGNCRESDRRASLALDHARQLLAEDAMIVDVFAAFCAKCAIEAGRDDRARDFLPQVMRLLTRHESLGASACATDVALHLWDGKEPAVLEEVRRAIGAHTPRLTVTFDCYLIRRLLRQGDVSGALRQASLAGLDPVRASIILPSGTRAHDERNLIVMTSLELLIAMDDWDSALPLLAAHKERARCNGRIGRLVQYELLELVRAVKLGDERQANRMLISAIRHAHAREIWRPFLEHRQTLLCLSNRAPIGTAWFTVRSEQQFFLRLVERLGLATSEGRAAPEDLASEALTGSEKRMLAMVGQGLSNPQIARLEGISDKTVKWHLRNVYRKLGATNRTMALRFAREAGVIDP
ncbi:LuxR C-terminal-related transcriptional regulator [Paracoccus sp. pheM1]|uniref:helix-turn-helix transcriptional regulator n=1 Tax=Paracoccus sp. pheM1 TaxID=2831675 RepID=UPI001BDB8F74|nr:LuxR C-terminal-related transcriptional regulator [Paracoccus sp. pheM1]MBT0782958.1 hypothetical protein [Paracoccus sp. pheM1]